MAPFCLGLAGRLTTSACKQNALCSRVWDTELRNFSKVQGLIFGTVFPIMEFFLISFRGQAFCSLSNFSDILFLGYFLPQRSSNAYPLLELSSYQKNNTQHHNPYKNFSQLAWFKYDLVFTFFFFLVELGLASYSFTYKWNFKTAYFKTLIFFMIYNVVFSRISV